jgi:CDP-glycerol glycerophosphotransferase (TagB/SpsB family)
MPREVIDEYKGISEPNYQFIETDDVMPYLQMADVMVSDTSSILQEFMQLHKPVVTFRNRTPGPWLIDIDDPGQLERAIEKALSRPDELLREIASYNADQHPWSDGKSSERVLDASEDMIRSTDNKLGKKPLNLVRKVKLRKQLNYWKP